MARELVKGFSYSVMTPRLCVLLTCFKGSKTARKIRKSLDGKIKEDGNFIIDEVVLQVNEKRKVRIYDPRKVLAGLLTPALTWGIFGVLSSGLRGLVTWAVIGSICGGLYAYFTEHALSKAELKRVGQALPPDSSALVSFIQSSGPETILTRTSPFKPNSASLAVIAPDLTAYVSNSQPSTRGASELLTVSQAPANRDALLSMLLFRYLGRDTAEKVEAEVGREPGASTVQTELVFAVNKERTIRITNPAKGAKAMARSDLISWGLFGVIYGAVIGFTDNPGIFSILGRGIETGIAWAVFGLFAGYLGGLWVGQAMSPRRLKGIISFLEPDTSLVLAWGEGHVAPEMITGLEREASQKLILKFYPTRNGAVLEL